MKMLEKHFPGDHAFRKLFNNSFTLLLHYCYWGKTFIWRKIDTFFKGDKWQNYYRLKKRDDSDGGGLRRIRNWAIRLLCNYSNLSKYRTFFSVQIKKLRNTVTRTCCKHLMHNTQRWRRINDDEILVVRCLISPPSYTSFGAFTWFAGVMDVRASLATLGSSTWQKNFQSNSQPNESKTVERNRKHR